jgi:hypothetical protein
MGLVLGWFSLGAGLPRGLGLIPNVGSWLSRLVLISSRRIGSISSVRLSTMSKSSRWGSAVGACIYHSRLVLNLVGMDLGLYRLYWEMDPVVDRVPCLVEGNIVVQDAGI